MKLTFLSPASVFLVLVLDLSSTTIIQAQQCDTYSAEGTCNNNVVASKNSSGEGNTDIELPPDVDCGIFMAPSTLGDKSNYGMFTAHPVKKGSILNYPEIAIPFMFRDWGEHPYTSFGDGQLWERYIWEGFVANLEAMNPWSQEEVRSVFVPGLGCTVNSILELNNIKSTHGSKYDTAGVTRSDPEAGAFTPYHHAVTSAETDIPSGSELFASYGDHWIPWIPDVAITMEKNLVEANEFLQDYKKFIGKLQEKYTSSQQQEESEIITSELLDKLYTKLIRGFPYKAPPFSVLPYEINHEELLKQELIKNTIQATKDKYAVIPDTHDYWRDRGIVDVNWLRQEGKCQDHMRPDISTIPNAGRGAFATRYLPKGTVVGYAPLVHIGERTEDTLTIHYNHTYGYNFGEKATKSKQDHHKMMDLIINYSFGHRDSTMILSPYGAMVNYINHSKEKANVKVVWPARELVAHKPEWLHKSLETMRDTNGKVGLSFDYVALRDIQEGEEIFMDYGDEWQQAWDAHVKKWKPPKDAKSYQHLKDYVANYGTNGNKESGKATTTTTTTTKHDIILKTPDEIKSNPYPPNIETMCQESYQKGADGKLYFLKVLRKTKARAECTVIDRQFIEPPTSGAAAAAADKRPASQKYLYTVEMIIYPEDKKGVDDDDDENDNEGLPKGPSQTITVHNVPYPEGIDLYDKVFSQDWHLPNAFRNRMYIPDEIFPEQWKNLKNGKPINKK